MLTQSRHSGATSALRLWHKGYGNKMTTTLALYDHQSCNLGVIGHNVEPFYRSVMAYNDDSKIQSWVFYHKRYKWGCLTKGLSFKKISNHRLMVIHTPMQKKIYSNSLRKSREQKPIFSKWLHKFGWYYIVICKPITINDIDDSILLENKVRVHALSWFVLKYLEHTILQEHIEINKKYGENYSFSHRKSSTSFFVPFISEVAYLTQKVIGDTSLVVERFHPLEQACFAYLRNK